MFIYGLPTVVRVSRGQRKAKVVAATGGRLIPLAIDPLACERTIEERSHRTVRNNGSCTRVMIVAKQPLNGRDDALLSIDGAFPAPYRNLRIFEELVCHKLEDCKTLRFATYCKRPAIARLV
jgi:hypothetical protein